MVSQLAKLSSSPLLFWLGLSSFSFRGMVRVRVIADDLPGSGFSDRQRWRLLRDQMGLCRGSGTFMG
ncbi:hypothetical protein Q3G72_018788 [Acer saccharum]|nr:hypothetical protein Q3G72_018788 [Acer saccharum]